MTLSAEDLAKSTASLEDRAKVPPVASDPVSAPDPDSALAVVSSSALAIVSSVALWVVGAGCGDEGEGGPRCATDEDCRPGARCDATGRCVEADCLRNEHCTALDVRTFCDEEARVCKFREGFGDECDRARPCPLGQFCTELLGLCLDSQDHRDCVRRSQCPGDQLCDRDVNKCVPNRGCLSDEYCEAEEVCDLVHERCRSIARMCRSCAAGADACAADSSCDSATTECVPVGGRPTCGAGERCDEQGRCVQCASTDECGPGLFCNESFGRCESRIQCAEEASLCPTSPLITCVLCDEGRVCDPRTKTCRAPATPCERQTDCPNGQICDLSLSPPVCVDRQPYCANDLLDDPQNDTSESARTLDRREGPSFDDLVLCQGDVDWYRMEVNAGTRLLVDTRFEHDDGDIDIALVLSDGRTVIADSRSTTDNERVEVEVGTDLVVLLKVYLAFPAPARVPYRLVVTRAQGALCPDDDHEPDDVLGAAKSIASDAPREGRICPADPDWFVVPDVPEGTRINARLDFTDSLGDLDLELFRAGARTPLISSLSRTDGERLTYDASFRGDFFLRVVGKGTDTNVYTIRVDLRPSEAPVCLDDRFEPNDASRPTSSNTNDSDFEDLTLCAGDEDWWRMTLDAGTRLGAEVEFLPDADLDLMLFLEPDDLVEDGSWLPSASPVAIASGTAPREWLTFRARRTSSVLLRVFGHMDSDISPYALRLRSVPTGTCSPDRFDLLGLGHDRASAVPLEGSSGPSRALRLDSLTFCGTDADWYRVELAPGHRNFIRLQSIESDVRLDFKLHDTDGQTLDDTTGTSGGNVRSVVIDALAASEDVPLYMEVSRTSGGDAHYNVTTDLVPRWRCEADMAEPNDTRSSASDAIASSTTAPSLLHLSLCATPTIAGTAGDEDWFLLGPGVPGARMEATVRHDTGDLFLELLSPGCGRRACSNSDHDRCYSDGLDREEHVTFTATTTRPYCLRVGSVFATPSLPEVPADSDTKYTLEIRSTVDR